MTPLAYCQQRAAPAGSTLHYSLLFLRPEIRRALLPIYAFHAEISASANSSDDLGVNDARLGWWLTELQRLGNGTPQHPVTQAMGGQANRDELQTATLMEIVAAYQRSLHSMPGSREERLSLCRATGGALEILAARASGCGDEQALHAAGELGAHIQRGEWVREAAVEAPTDGRPSFLATPAEIVGDLQQAISGVPVHAQPSLRCPRTRAGILIAAFSKHPPARESGRKLPLSISPLHKLWIAWRTGSS